jgi:hypothetical protein
MERSAERSFCCGAGGARMWMEENLGERINSNRTKEAVATGADQIAVGCPFCRVMLSDGLTAEQASGAAREDVEVLDVAQMLLASVKGESATKVSSSTATAPVETRAEPFETPRPSAPQEPPEPGDETRTADTVTETADVGPAAKASGGSSLFDVEEPEAATSVETTSTGGSLFDTEEPAAPAAGGSLFDVADQTPPSATEGRPDADQVSDGGSLFDIAGTSPESESSTTAPEASPEVEEKTPAGGSLFDVEPEDAEPAEPAERADPAPSTYSGSLFDVEEETSEDSPAEPEASAETNAPEEKIEDQKPEPKKDVDLDEGGSLFDI